MVLLSSYHALLPKETILSNHNHLSPLPGIVPALKDSDASALFYKQRLSNDTIIHFELGVFQSDSEKPSSRRIIMPERDLQGNLVAYRTHALHTEANCKQCNEIVYSHQVKQAFDKARDAETTLNMKTGSLDDQWQNCPHCNASKNKARISWLIGQMPYENGTTNSSFYQGRKDSTSSMIYNMHNAVEAWKQDPNQPLVICRSVEDCWAAHEAGFPVSVYFLNDDHNHWTNDSFAEILAAGPSEIKILYTSDVFHLSGITHQAVKRAQQRTNNIAASRGTDSKTLVFSEVTDRDGRIWHRLQQSGAVATAAWLNSASVYQEDSYEAEFKLKLEKMLAV